MITRLAGKQKPKRANPKRSFLFQKIKLQINSGRQSRLAKKLIPKTENATFGKPNVAQSVS